jgi:hypothetical protein
MIDSPHDSDKVFPIEKSTQTVEELPYRVELWQGKAVERVLARAFSSSLAHAIFKAAAAEYPERRITLQKGIKVLADSGK